MTQPLRLYRHPLSGHAHRVETFLSMLGVPFDRIDVNVLTGEHKQPDFLAKNKLGQVPVLEDGDVRLADSNAILVYLALRYDASGRWLPREPVAAARVQRWLSIAAGELVRGPNALRLAALLKAPVDRQQAESTAARLLAFIEETLSQQSFLAADHATIADLAIYAYTSLAPEGGIALEPYPSLRAWHARVEALAGFVPMQRARTS